MELINIKLIDERDLEDILILQKNAFMVIAKQMNKYDIQPLLQTLQDIRIESQKSIILKYISANNQIVGSIRGYMDDEHTCHLGKLIVHPDYQNQGVGKALMYEIENYFPSCHKFMLFTSDETPNTLHLYNKVGYQVVSKKEIDGTCMFIMKKMIRC